jgi:hypothetical protein
MAVTKPRGNVVRAPLRWSIDAAAPEFGMGVNTMRKLLNQASIAPGEDGCYATAQLLSAIYGRMHEEKLRTQEQLTRKYALENAITEGSYLDRAELSKGLALIADAMCAIISNSNLSREAQEDLRKELAGIEIICEDVARAQSRLPRGQRGRRSKNGQAGEGED